MTSVILRKEKWDYRQCWQQSLVLRLPDNFFSWLFGCLKLCQTETFQAGSFAIQYLLLLKHHHATSSVHHNHLPQEPGGQKG